MMTVLIGDALEELKKLPSESVHCVVTSPPYWGLRDYSRCSCAVHSCSKGEPSVEGVGGNSMSPRPNPPNPNCPICRGTGIIEGVKEHQLGLEKTPEEYVKHLVEVFREVKRVLRNDGTLWLNIADSYASEPFDPWGIKPKDEVDVSARTAQALQKDGWWKRCTVIWSKPNPMPESVTDRPTKSHEYIFLLTKSARYFYDQEAIREVYNYDGRKKLTIDGGGKTKDTPRPGNPQTINRDGGDRWPSSGRNIRTVWEITTQPYPEAHFATFPEELPRRCIKAGTSQKGCCPKCGAPWERIIEKKRPERWKDSGPTTEKEQAIRAISESIYGGNQKSRSISDIFGRATKSTIVHKGWQPTCECGEAETTQCTVLDPFAGSGTTGQVAKELGRSAILIELNPVYDDMIRVRIGIGVKSGPLDAIAVGTEGE